MADVEMAQANGRANGPRGSTHFSLIIDGKDVPASETFDVYESTTGDVVHSAPAASAEQAVAAVESADRAFETWRDSTPIERRSILNKAVEILQKRKDELVDAMVRETGAKPSWCAFNVKVGIEFVMEGAGMVTQIKGDILPSNDKGMLAFVFKEPVGVVLGIAPWNAPIILSIRSFITPIVCGNTAILKASESSPYTQYLVADCFRQAGLPAGVLNFICCPRNSAAAVTEAMVAHDAVTRVNFTGSTAVGRIIGNMCARYMKPVVLELGGKAPMVVLKDANLEEAVKAAAFGAMMHQGQICMSTERVIVHRSVAEKFKQLFQAKINSLYSADPKQDPKAPIGSLITQAAGNRVRGLLEDALSKGASVLGGKLEIKGSISQPIALTNVNKSMDIYYQESFGPTVAVYEFDTNEEAIKLANDTEYGLVSSVYSDDIPEALAVARRIKSGSCHINGPTVHDEPHLPLGGQKSSGYGRFGGLACINEFTEERVVTIGRHGHHYPV
jgi:acyl-CoA reductase-like NAD-dependent aldehyde dehydrogenase